MYYPPFRDKEIKAERNWVAKGKHTFFASHSFYFYTLILKQQTAPGLQRIKGLQQMHKLFPHINQQTMSSLIETLSSFAFIQILCQHPCSDLAFLSGPAEIGTSESKAWRKRLDYLEWRIRGCTFPWHTKRAWGKESDIYAFPCARSFNLHNHLVNMYIYNRHIHIHACHRIHLCYARHRASIISTLSDAASE